MDKFLDSESYNNLLGSQLRSLREEKKLTQFVLAERSNVHENTIKEIELGKKMPSIYTLYKISIGLGIKLEKMIEDL